MKCPISVAPIHSNDAYFKASMIGGLYAYLSSRSRRDLSLEGA